MRDAVEPFLRNLLEREVELFERLDLVLDLFAEGVVFNVERAQHLQIRLDGRRLRVDGTLEPLACFLLGERAVDHGLLQVLVGRGERFDLGRGPADLGCGARDAFLDRVEVEGVGGDLQAGERVRCRSLRGQFQVCKLCRDRLQECVVSSATLSADRLSPRDRCNLFPKLLQLLPQPLRVADSCVGQLLDALPQGCDLLLESGPAL